MNNDWPGEDDELDLALNDAALEELLNTASSQLHQQNQKKTIQTSMGSTRVLGIIGCTRTICHCVRISIALCNRPFIGTHWLCCRRVWERHLSHRLWCTICIDGIQMASWYLWHRHVHWSPNRLSHVRRLCPSGPRIQWSLREDFHVPNAPNCGWASVSSLPHRKWCNRIWWTLETDYSSHSMPLSCWSLTRRTEPREDMRTHK